MVGIDPGHNGANDSYTAKTKRLVDPSGVNEACNTSRLADVYENWIDELPREHVEGGRSRPGGAGLLAEYLLAINRIGATAEAADAFEAISDDWVEGTETS